MPEDHSVIRAEGEKDDEKGQTQDWRLGAAEACHSSLGETVYQ